MEEIVEAQKIIFECIERSMTNYKKDSPGRKTERYFANRIKLLGDYWDECKINHKNAIKQKKENEVTYKQYVDSKLYAEIEDLFFAFKTQLEEDKVKMYPEEHLTTRVQLVQDNMTAEQSVGSGGQVVEPIIRKEEVKLPRINIPKFSGEYQHWMSFHDMYTALVHNNKSITNIEKLHYLKSSLQGEAEEFVRHFTITDANYQVAWKALQERYDNRRILIKTQLKLLFSQTVANVESASNIRKILDTTNECIQALENLGIDTQHWDVMITHLVSERLPIETKKLWEQEIGAEIEFPKYETLKKFLEGQFRALESFGHKTDTKPMNKKHSLHANNVYSCIRCGGPHSLRHCPQFLALNFEGKRSFIIQKQLCNNCLAKGHIASLCQSRSSCFKCKRRHHTLLHIESAGEPKTESQEGNDTESSKETMDKKDPSTSSVYTEHNVLAKEVLLATAIVKLISESGHEITVRTLIDQGSQSTFISETVAQRLKLNGTAVNTRIMGIGNVEAGVVRRKVTVIVGSLNNNRTTIAEALVLNSLTGVLPSKRIRVSESWKHLRGLTLADPQYFLSGKIEMIIGADVYGAIILNGLKVGSNGGPIAQKTIFGWILSGETVNTMNNQINNYTSSFNSYTTLDNQLQKFWEMEEIPSQRHLTPEEKSCEEHYANTVQRLEDGRYLVRLPFKNSEELPQFGRSRGSASIRLKQLEARFAESEDLRLEYARCLQEYIDYHHMSPVASSEIENMCYNKVGKVFYKTNYLPHHAVFKDSTTTKLRVVFDASHKTFCGPSLNQTLLNGPKLQDDLYWIILRWRKYPVVITADIEKMYRQIRMHHDDSDYQRILWRNSPNEPVKDFKLQTVTFGTTSAPYLAIRTLQQLAEDENSRYPVASNTVKSDFYVDDLLTGAYTTDECIKLQQELIGLLKSGGFNLRKWTSNKQEVLQNIPIEDIELDGSRGFDQNEGIKTLGIIWHPNSDQFKYTLSIDVERNSSITKRKFLSIISKLFDPLGFLAPLTVKFKILMQILWIRGTGWDEEIPTDIMQSWKGISSQLKLIEKIEIPRWIFTSNKSVEIHGFCDGSLQAYAAVLYVRSKDHEGNFILNLLTSKTKVTPIKTISLPRIELCGALLLARLFKTVQRALKFDHIIFHAWTDSEIVLSWLRGHPNKYKMFVANRISEIQEICSSNVWSHVRSESNPADCATRGLLPKDLLTFEMWWNGPNWLKQPKELWPATSVVEECDLEAKTLKVNTMITKNSSNLELLITRCSSLTKLIRITAYCFRFMNSYIKREKTPESKYLTTTELKFSLKFWIKTAQNEQFGKEIHELETKNSITGRLQNLNPFLDQEGILRVGGRLQNANISWNEKHPIILENNHLITKLLVDLVHKNTLHGGVQLMTAVLRQNYWVLNARSVLKQTVFKCTICFRQKAEYRQQLMGNLPKSRVQASRVFDHVGVDYCGPLEIKTSKLKNAKMTKAYLSIFICLVTRAIHIEVVSELTTQAFIAALKRFVGRRGLCSNIYSDNATNFVGTRNIIQMEFKKYLLNLNEKVPEIAINEGINWHFIPPASPHFGGLWEAGVKSTKHHLKRILGNNKLTFEELTTTVIQIEACLNSRPICPLTNDPNDINALTPGHFLVGGPLLAIPEESYIQQNEHRLNRWQHIQQLMQSFWKRWQTEYLHSLQQRPKWMSRTKNLRNGDLVLIRDENLPPCKWLLARILETHPGSDGLVRVVTIKTKNGVFKRAISKVCLLPIEDNYSETQEV